MTACRAVPALCTRRCFTALQGAARRVLADNHNLPVIDVGFDNRQHVRVPAHLGPDDSLLFEGLNIHVLIARQLERQVRRTDALAVLAIAGKESA